MKKILWIGDAACPSGFARATHAILDVVRSTFDVTVLGLNYNGDPHPYNKTPENPTGYDIYSCFPGGDMFGIGRLVWMCDLVKPDVIVVQNDPWNVPLYTQHLKQFKEYADVPVVAIVAVDGKNCLGKGLNDVSLAVFWTQFALDEARAGGFTGAGLVIPLGVDLDQYRPIDRYEARLRRGLPRDLDDAFIVGNVNRNQPRKRWDLTIKYFAEWLRYEKAENAYLFLHAAPTGDTGVRIRDLATYYGVLPNLILMEPQAFYGVSEDEMRDTYNCFDVQISTTQGEGFGLTTFEGMACGVPQIVPAWSALGELCEGAARLVPCTSTAIGPPYVNVIGGVADEAMFVTELSALYNSADARRELREAGLARVREERFRWTHIGEAFRDVLIEVPETYVKAVA